MSEVGKWLQGIGLGQYADGFDTNEIDMELLRQVDDQLLKDLGVSMWLVPGEGIEPPTFGLQNRCSTAELTRRADL